jgi:RNA polymerase sigma factor (sigma-70 family)
MTDDQLVALVRRGDERAFTLLVERHRARLVRYATGRLGCADAEDVVQEALVRAYAALRRGADPESLVAWLHAIVRNGARDAHRRRSRQQGAPLHDDLPAVGDGPDAVVERRLHVAATFDGLRALPDRQREALAQVALAGRSYDEVAAAQETSVTAVKALVNRARTNLRRAVASFGGLLPAKAPAAAVVALVASAATVPGFSISVPAVSVPPAVADQLARVEQPAPAPAARTAAASAVAPATGTRAAAARHVLRACADGDAVDRYDTASLLRARAAMPADVAEYTDCDARLSDALDP